MAKAEEVTQAMKSVQIHATRMYPLTPYNNRFIKLQ